MDTLKLQAKQARQSALRLGTLTTAQKDQALSAVAAALEREIPAILEANALDVAEAKKMHEAGELSKAMFKRLQLNEAKLNEIIRGVRAVRELPDPAGKVLERRLLDDGLELHKVSVPLGVLAVIFESRPDAVTQISSLALKSGNAVLLKGGREVENTTRELLRVMRDALVGTAVPADALQAVYGREAVNTLLAFHEEIDLVIPRGSNALVQYVQKNTIIPVLGHADGVCHIFVHRDANFDMALDLVLDAKVQYPAVCNAVETILIDEPIAERLLPDLYERLRREAVHVRGCVRTRALLPEKPVELVGDDEWHTEYGDFVIALKVVDGLEHALDHIERYGSHHTDAIVTDNQRVAECFLREVDSAGVFHNASTRFADGYRYGFGAEVGISTSKLHARGPVGLEGLVSYKYKLYGTGQKVADYVGPTARSFKHQIL
jgi:glutamate-5-semialdehyde dehydrogenase